LVEKLFGRLAKLSENFIKQLEQETKGLQEPERSQVITSTVVASLVKIINGLSTEQKKVVTQKLITLLMPILDLNEQLPFIAEAYVASSLIYAKKETTTAAEFLLTYLASICTLNSYAIKRLPNALQKLSIEILKDGFSKLLG